MRRLFLGLTLILGISILGLTGGCTGDDGESGPDGGPRVVTSLEIFADMVRNVAGERADVEALLPSGSDPHTFELAPSRVADVVEADIIFMNGLELEHSIEDIVANNAEGPVIELAEGLPVLTNDQQYTEEEGEAAPEGSNPHLWLDVRLGARYVERIRDELIAIDPEGRETYEANAQVYLERLGDLDREMEEAVLAIPAERRKLVTFHDAYPYLAERYGLEIVGVVVPSPGQEPSAQDIAELTDKIESQGVPAVFKEPQFNAAILERAADEAGVRVLDLLSDAYVDGVDSYVSLIEYDIRQLQEGLGGG
jgi:ABC-type Zn uptake system ZnuABC Zn-binding protein ZnuA